MSGIVTLWLNPWNTNLIPNKRQSFCPIAKVFWRLLRFIQGHKWRSFTLQLSCGTKSGMKIRVYRKWYIRVSVNPGVNPCKPPLVFGQASFESIMHTCNHLFTTYPDIFQRISSTLGLVCRLNVGFKCSPVNPTADAFTLHCLKMCCMIMIASILWCQWHVFQWFLLLVTLLEYLLLKNLLLWLAINR